jgi:hypothetical protein
MPKYEIAINISPQAQPPDTVPNTELQPLTSAESGYDSSLSLQSIAKLAVGSIAVKTLATTALGAVGDLTGDQKLQRELNEALQIGSYIAQIMVAGPLVGGVAVATQLVARGVEENIKIKNINISSRYQNTLRGNRVRGNR